MVSVSTPGTALDLEMLVFPQSPEGIGIKGTFPGSMALSSRQAVTLETSVFKKNPAHTHVLFKLVMSS